ncbi:SCO-spondin-like [Pelobates fuscus]|uniref:SCO-spondin-like n=1 Tax=Pelobates fuscus TaxID=191477 RepID=UPI002FE4766A
MTSRQLLVLGLVIAISFAIIGKLDATSVRPICPPGKIFRCANDCAESCQYLNGNKICTMDCAFKCACPADTYLQDNTCVPASQCRVDCFPNSHFDHCPGFQEVYCDTLKKERVPNNKCYPRCVCNEGYVLSEFKCVKISECPKKGK